MCYVYITWLIRYTHRLLVLFLVMCGLPVVSRKTAINNSIFCSLSLHAHAIVSQIKMFYVIVIYRLLVVFGCVCSEFGNENALLAFAHTHAHIYHHHGIGISRSAFRCSLRRHCSAMRAIHIVWVCVARYTFLPLR